ncbi:hypothetical protein PILCRDRAFT_190980 [Piloderma croceum F 1598]|uniref:Uncharacterized protein n=1 Tax=Piloderma croceum (strain F 1598) TaxID=765440 RepID=A0A0C3GCZ8_PILCF|nr:hypothetical protein PILCRDRAFT_190980 [Piloderma croceum F 1598]
MKESQRELGGYSQHLSSSLMSQLPLPSRILSIRCIYKLCNLLPGTVQTQCSLGETRCTDTPAERLYSAPKDIC